MSLAKQVLESYKNKAVTEAELSDEVKDQIKDNNDEMSDLKANGGSQEEIDALEKENDELNGGNKTFDEDASIPPKFNIAMAKLDVKPVGKQAEILLYALKNLVERMADKQANKMELKAWSAHFLGAVTHGVEDISDEVEMEESEENPLSGEVRDDEESEEKVVESKGLARKVLESHINERSGGLPNSRLKLLKEVEGKKFYFFNKMPNLVFITSQEPDMDFLNKFKKNPEAMIGQKINVNPWSTGKYDHKITGVNDDGKVELWAGKNGFTAFPEEIAILMTIEDVKQKSKGDDKIARSQDNIKRQKDGEDVLGEKKAWADIMKAFGID